ncbi:unnamed protein product [Acanthoscelides obtectus]|jgi:hypothetical protein
MNC